VRRKTAVALFTIKNTLCERRTHQVECREAEEKEESKKARRHALGERERENPVGALLCIYAVLARSAAASSLRRTKTLSNAADAEPFPLLLLLLLLLCMQLASLHAKRRHIESSLVSEREKATLRAAYRLHDHRVILAAAAAACITAQFVRE